MYIINKTNGLVTPRDPLVTPSAVCPHYLLHSCSCLVCRQSFKNLSQQYIFYFLLSSKLCTERIFCQTEVSLRQPISRSCHINFMSSFFFSNSSRFSLPCSFCSSLTLWQKSPLRARSRCWWSLLVLKRFEALARRRRCGCSRSGQIAFVPECTRCGWFRAWPAGICLFWPAPPEPGSSSKRCHPFGSQGTSPLAPIDPNGMPRQPPSPRSNKDRN